MTIVLNKALLINIHLHEYDEALEAFQTQPDFFNRHNVSRLIRLLKNLGHKQFKIK